MSRRDKQGLYSPKISAQHIGEKLIAAKHDLIFPKSHTGGRTLCPAAQRLFRVAFEIERKLFYKGLHPAFRRI